MLQTFLSEFMDVNFQFLWVYINLGVELQTCIFCSLLFVVRKQFCEEWETVIMKVP